MSPHLQGSPSQAPSPGFSLSWRATSHPIAQIYKPSCTAHCHRGTGVNEAWLPSVSSGGYHEAQEP